MKICSSLDESIQKVKNKFTTRTKLGKIVKDKRNMPIKLKDGQMKVDLYTASAFVQTLDKIKKPDTKKKLEFIINKGNKAQFLRTVDVIFK